MTNRDKAVLRVLRLVDGYLSTRDKDLLLAWKGGLMTWGELRTHVQGAIKIMRSKKQSSKDSSK